MLKMIRGNAFQLAEIQLRREGLENYTALEVIEKAQQIVKLITKKRVLIQKELEEVKKLS